MQVLNKGAHSTIFIDENEPGIVIKKPHKSADGDIYLKQQQHGYDIIESIKARSKDLGVVLPEIVEINEKDKTIREKMVSGVIFDKTNKVYSGLSEEHKDDIAKQMAIFLNAMHSSSKCQPAEESIINMRKDGPKNADEIIAKFDGRLPKSVTNKLKAAEQYLQESDKSDELIVMTHKDLRKPNLMYDANTNKLAVIDFELAGLDNVYHDFIASAPASSMPWDFTKRVIDYYNKIPDKKYPIKINPKKVQNMLLYGVLHEYARCIKPGDNENSTEQDVISLCNNLESVTGINFDNRRLYENAIKKVQAMGNKKQPSIKIQNNIGREDR